MLLEEHERLRQQWDAIKNYVIGLTGISIGLADITNIAQAIAAVGGAILVMWQLYDRFKKKRK